MPEQSIKRGPSETTEERNAIKVTGSISTRLEGILRRLEDSQIDPFERERAAQEILFLKPAEISGGLPRVIEILGTTPCIVTERAIIEVLGELGGPATCAKPMLAFLVSNRCSEYHLLTGVAAFRALLKIGIARDDTTGGLPTDELLRRGIASMSQLGQDLRKIALGVVETMREGGRYSWIPEVLRKVTHTWPNRERAYAMQIAQEVERPKLQVRERPMTPPNIRPVSDSRESSPKRNHFSALSSQVKPSTKEAKNPFKPAAFIIAGTRPPSPDVSRGAIESTGVPVSDGCLLDVVAKFTSGVAKDFEYALSISLVFSPDSKRALVPHLKDLLPSLGEPEKIRVQCFIEQFSA